MKTLLTMIESYNSLKSQKKTKVHGSSSSTDLQPQMDTDKSTAASSILSIPSGERMSAKVIWHRTTVGSQTDEESFWEKREKRRELLNVYLFVLAL